MAFPTEILQRLEEGGVVAGFPIDKVEHAIPLSRALLEGGIGAIELTLRTPVAMEALRAVCSEVPEMLVGVGTILTPDTAIEVKEAGADFGVSPGTNPRVVQAAKDVGLLFAPGICRPSDLEAATVNDYTRVFLRWIGVAVPFRIGHRERPRAQGWRGPVLINLGLNN